MISAQVYPSRPPQCEFVQDNRIFSGTPANTLFSLSVNPEMYRRKIWFACAYYGTDANFKIDSEVIFSYRGERLFALPVQYNTRTGTSNGSQVDAYWSSMGVLVNVPAATLNDEPLTADVNSNRFLAATPFRGTFVCDKIEWIYSRLTLTGQSLYAFLACQSEYPY